MEKEVVRNFVKSFDKVEKDDMDSEIFIDGMCD
jgi:hypothetical protein